MIWVFWGLLAFLLGGMLVMTLLVRRPGVRRYRSPRPPLSRILWAFGHSFRYGLWGIGPRYGFFRHDPPNDPGEEYVREYERDLDQRDDDGSK